MLFMSGAGKMIGRDGRRYMQMHRRLMNVHQQVVDEPQIGSCLAPLRDGRCTKNANYEIPDDLFGRSDFYEEAAMLAGLVCLYLRFIRGEKIE